MFNEKIFIFLWFWYLFVAIFSAFSLFHWILLSFLPGQVRALSNNIFAIFYYWLIYCFPFTFMFLIFLVNLNFIFIRCRLHISWQQWWRLAKIIKNKRFEIELQKIVSFQLFLSELLSYWLLNFAFTWTTLQMFKKKKEIREKQQKKIWYFI